MRRFRWAILIGELVLLAAALAVPRMDLPETTFNEADTPINQATVVVVLGCRSALTGLRSAATTTAAAVVHFYRTDAARADAFSPWQPARSGSLLALLCTLLC
jgi:hypothetical protein